MQKIKDSTIAESFKQAQIHQLLRGLVGADRVNYIEFIQLITYFNSNTILKDYKILLNIEYVLNLKQILILKK